MCNLFIKPLAVAPDLALPAAATAAAAGAGTGAPTGLLCDTAAADPRFDAVALPCCSAARIHERMSATFYGNLAVFGTTYRVR
jgi:hypothetical protein